MSRPRVVVVRGHAANPWELGVWELLRERFDISVLVSESNAYDISEIPLERRTVRALRDLLPRGRIGDLAVHLPGDRFLRLDHALEGADIVHSAELGTWFAAQPAALKGRLGFKLVLTVWETIPFLERFLDPPRASRFRRARAVTSRAGDLFLAATERARCALELEGIDPERIAVSSPGVDVQRFAAARGGSSDGSHLIVSPGRLVWEKGHYDVIRAIALLGGDHRLLIVGAGREHDRLLAYAAELGVAERVDIRAVPYAEMPSVFGQASAVVLASLPIPTWEEQFGMVLAEALAAGAPIVASACGAIPEVLAGTGASVFEPGDWAGLARLLANGPLADVPSARIAYDPALVHRYSREAAAERLTHAYERVLGV